MPQPSFTSSDSFAVRAQRSEVVRVLIWISVLVGMLLLTLIRRWVGGHVMSDNAMFFPYTGALVVGLIYQFILLNVLRRANRDGVLLTHWLWRSSAIFDLGVAAGLLIVSAFFSPRGPIAGLSSPPLLLVPLVICLSVLRLRAAFTLYIGLTGAVIHFLLALRAIYLTGPPHEMYPVYLAYGFILMLTAIAARFVAAEVRGHVREAADEAAARELANRQVFGMQRDLSVARDIQRGLLPQRPPTLANFEITGMNRPADQTGGDYYDWLLLPDGKLAVVLADVSGHGIGPALVMAVCRAYVRASAPTFINPAAMMAHLNTLLHIDLPSDRFITLALTVLDANGAAQLISAGHGPTLLYRAATRQVTQFNGDGLPLGVAPDEIYGPTTSITLDQDDVLVMLTDGFFEWSRPADGELFGIPRLEAALAACASGNAESILKSIDQSVTQFCDGSPQPDDMTAIVIKRTAPATAPSITDREPEPQLISQTT